MTQVTAALIEAGKEVNNIQKLYDAILWNKRVWDTFAYELAADDNQLPREIRAGLISLAIWVNRETTHIMDGQTDLEPLITVNRSIIEGLPRIANSDFVFTNDGVRPIAAWVPAKARIDELANIAPWVVHDLRRTTATGLQKLKTPLQVTEAILGHTAGSRAGVVGIYQRHDYADEKRAALEAWGAHIVKLVKQ